jgi:mannose-6-phosphate isomerase-like protein (cupin superfamily)
MKDIDASAESYTSEPVRYPPLQVIDLAAESGAVGEQYRNFVLGRVNEHCLRMSVMEGAYPWHSHPGSDELFLVLEGELIIEFNDRAALRLQPQQAATVPAGTIHRTRAERRTVSLCFESLAAQTQFVPTSG